MIIEIDDQAFCEERPGLFNPFAEEHPYVPTMKWLEEIQAMILKDVLVQHELAWVLRGGNEYRIFPEPFTILLPGDLPAIEVMDEWDPDDFSAKYGTNTGSIYDVRMHAGDVNNPYEGENTVFAMIPGDRPFTVVGYWSDSEVGGTFGYVVPEDPAQTPELVVLFA